VKITASCASGRPQALFLFATAVTLLADQLTKYLAVSFLAPAVPRRVLGTLLSLTLTHNVASAFGLGLPNSVLLAVGVLVSLAIVWYVTLGKGLTSRPSHALALAMVLGGSLGNLADRLRTKGVVDFIDFRIWPVFNLADVAITAGFALLAIRLLRPR